MEDKKDNLYLNLCVVMPRELDKGDWGAKVSGYLALQGITYLGSSERSFSDEKEDGLEDEARKLREQYLEIEEKLKELGKTTKRVQTFVSKLKDNK